MKHTTNSSKFACQNFVYAPFVKFSLSNICTILYCILYTVTHLRSLIGIPNTLSSSIRDKSSVITLGLGKFYSSCKHTFVNQIQLMMRDLGECLQDFGITTADLSLSNVVWTCIRGHIIWVLVIIFSFNNSTASCTRNKWSSFVIVFKARYLWWVTLIEHTTDYPQNLKIKHYCSNT